MMAMSPSTIFVVDFRSGTVRCSICDNEVDVDPEVDDVCPMCGSHNEVEG